MYDGSEKCYSVSDLVTGCRPPRHPTAYPARLSDAATDKEAARRVIGRQVEYFDNQARPTHAPLLFPLTPAAGVLQAVEARSVQGTAVV